MPGVPLDQDPSRDERGEQVTETQPAWAKRIEAKLDALMKALAEDEQDEDSGVDLEGRPLPAPRNPDDPL